MASTRHKNMNWTLPTNTQGDRLTWDHAKIAVLMDIRDELQYIKEILCPVRDRLNCSETMRIPALLRAIKKNTTKKRRARKKVQA